MSESRPKNSPGADVAGEIGELDEFAYLVVHDLKEPLRGMVTYARFLQQDHTKSLDADGRELVESIASLGKKMSRMLEDLLQCSILGHSESRLALTNMNELLDQVKDSLADLMRESGTQWSVPTPLPSLRCVPPIMARMFSILIRNAIQYNVRDVKRVEVGVAPTGHSALQGRGADGPVFYVKDNGIGIKQEHLEDIFKIYRRLNGKESFGEGMGAGLTIARRMIRRQGGELWATSEFGCGSTFFFSLGQEKDD